MSLNSDTSGNKRARKDMVSATTSSSTTVGGQRNALPCSCFDVNQRAKELPTKKLLSLYQEFPEMNFIVKSQKMQQTHVGTAVEKYKEVINKHVEGEAKKREAML